MNDWKEALSALTGVAVPEVENGKKEKEAGKVSRRKRSGVVYSTDADYDYSDEAEEGEVTLPPSQQRLRLAMERAGRAGKTVTIVRGFVGAETDLKALCKMLKQKCGVGGSVKDGEIVMQGDRRGQLLELLKKEGYTQVK